MDVEGKVSLHQLTNLLESVVEEQSDGKLTIKLKKEGLLLQRSDIGIVIFAVQIKPLPLLLLLSPSPLPPPPISHLSPFASPSLGFLYSILNLFKRFEVLQYEGK